MWSQFRTLLLVIIPSFFVQGMANSYQEHAFYDSLGRLAFIVGALWLLLFSPASTGSGCRSPGARPT